MVNKLRYYFRRWLYTKLALVGKEKYVYKSRPIVNSRCRFYSKLNLGDNCHFNGMTTGGAGIVTIGDNFHSGPECVIWTENHNINGLALPYDDTYVIKNVLIGDNVWLGRRVMILPGVTIGDGAVIQAGSVVVSDIPSLAIAGGSPAKVFSMRNKEHYDNLLKEERFY